MKFFLHCSISDEQVSVFWKSMRTRYGKLSGLRTGQETHEFSKREQWILDNFYFLEQHVNRLKKKRRVSSKVYRQQTIMSYVNIFQHLNIYCTFVHIEQLTDIMSYLLKLIFVINVFTNTQLTTCSTHPCS